MSPFAMDLSQRKEQFSYGYLLATATAAGFWLSDPRVDLDSIDCSVRAQGQEGRYSSPQLDIQLKCKAEAVTGAAHISYQLQRKNYDDLRDDTRMLPIILTVLLVPLDDEQWLEHGNEQWLSRYCCYWADLRGMPPLEEDAGSKAVHIPQTQRLTVVELRRLMANISRTSRV